MRPFIMILLLIYNVLGYEREICGPHTSIISSYSLDKGVNIDNITTRNKINFSVTIKAKEGWPEKSSLLMINSERDETVFRYMPYGGEVVQDNSRVKLREEHAINPSTVNFTFSFLKNLDDESRWKLSIQWKEYDILSSELCSFFVRSDQTPFVTIETKALGKGKTIINKFNENDKIRVTCTLNKSNRKLKNPPFKLIFPEGSKVVTDISIVNGEKVSMILTLTRNILNKVIYCFVNGGDNATDRDSLNFNLNIVYDKKTGTTTVAISLAVLICILLLVMTIAGAYLLIVKQRKDTTKHLVKHHTVTQQKTNYTEMSRISRMSRLSRLSRSSKLSKFEVVAKPRESQLRIIKP